MGWSNPEGLHIFFCKRVWHVGHRAASAIRSVASMGSYEEITYRDAGIGQRQANLLLTHGPLKSLGA